MRARLRAIVLFAVALTPSAYLAWRWRGMPHLGLHHDDGLYLATAKSLAEGRGYRIDSLPGRPYQTKYPPVTSLLLAVLWRCAPRFPDNLPWATLLAWLMFPPYLFLARATFRRYGLAESECWVLTFAAACYPLACLLTTVPMSDILFLPLFLGCLLLAERAAGPRATPWLAFAAGLIAISAVTPTLSRLPLSVALDAE